ncbi:uncharacterized protein LOC116162948 [Photinus pyralis]|uniref:uncharacterized protein LOC116162948 n=1 Tax=Photinus pyralis TaxID=7054 RepID=UPI0012672CC2|nr:uncharacterized protein LOC116162948 [Photinus pyralis]
MSPRNKIKLLIYLSIYFCVSLSAVNCELNETRAETDFGSELLEEGRTLAHNTLKRLSFIAPAIFFKLGIAFTLLLVVALVAANNGFIGFLILVVGLSTVLSRFQTRPTPIVQSLPAPVAALPLSYPAAPQFAHHHHHNAWFDRSDNIDTLEKASKTVNGYYGLQQDNYYDSGDLRDTGVLYKTKLNVAPYTTIK